MDGDPFRALGNAQGLSGVQVYRRVVQECTTLPNNTELSQHYSTRWSGMLNVDGKYIAIKGFKKKLPFIWCVDFLQHDFPVGLLAHSESITAFTQLFASLKKMNYPLRVVISDDVAPLKIALKRSYPNAQLQLCHVHYIENIRQQLHVRTQDTYHHFFHSLLTHVFADSLTRNEREAGLLYVLEQRTNHIPLLQSIILAIATRFDDLFAYTTIQGCPKTNNLIECFNSHLNGRLKTVKGFQSFASAQLWLNAYVIRRRTKPFTDCETPFKHYNGKMPLQNSIDLSQPFPTILGIKTPKS